MRWAFPRLASDWLVEVGSTAVIVAQTSGFAAMKFKSVAMRTMCCDVAFVFALPLTPPGDCASPAATFGARLVVTGSTVGASELVTPNPVTRLL